MGQNDRNDDYEREIELLFSEENLRTIWRWLDELEVPPEDREEVMRRVFQAGAHTLASKSLKHFDPCRVLQKLTVHMAAHYWDDHPTGPPGEPPAIEDPSS